MAGPIRGELWKCAFGPQYYDDGVVHGSVETADRIIAAGYCNQVFGLHSTANLPDPSFYFEPHWAFGTASKRNFYTAHKSKSTLTGSVPDITLLNGLPLFLPLGYCRTSGVDKAAGGGSDLNEPAGTARGDTVITLTDATGYAVDDYIQIGVPASDNCEVRKITDVTGNDVTVDYPLCYVHDDAEVCNEVEAPSVSETSKYFTHLSEETLELNPIQIHTEYQDVNGGTPLMRRYVGAKVNRATFTASEGDLVKFSLDEVISRTMKYEDEDATDVEPWYTADISTVTCDYPTTEPYYFSYGTMTIAGTTFARIREFKLDISNNIEPKYYVQYDSVGTQEGQVPYELREGRKEYGLSLTVDAADASLFLHLCRQGVYSSTYTGFAVVLTLTRGTNDTITITMPADGTPAAGGDELGCLIRSAPHNIVEAPLVSIPLDILVRSIQVEVKDNEYYYI